MDRSELLRPLREHQPILRERFGVTGLVLFGSAARNEASPASDVDIRVSFGGPATSARSFGVQFCLEDLLRRGLDRVTDKALRPRLRPVVERDAIAV